MAIKNTKLDPVSFALDKENSGNLHVPISLRRENFSSTDGTFAPSGQDKKNYTFAKDYLIGVELGITSTGVGVIIPTGATTAYGPYVRGEFVHFNLSDYLVVSGAGIWQVMSASEFNSRFVFATIGLED